jgi:hypothetical protein
MYDLASEEDRVTLPISAYTVLERAVKSEDKIMSARPSPEASSANKKEE